MARSNEQSSAAPAVTTQGRSGEPRGEVPRWLVIGGATAALTLLLALLRFAIDLLGVVFLLVLAGFSLRALSDWLADGDSVSGWSILAVLLSVFGTFAVGLWLFDGRAAARSSVIERRLPVVLTRAIDWAEAQGWGRRVLLPGGPIDRMARREAASPAPAQAGETATAHASGARPGATAPRAGEAATAPQLRVKTAAPRRRERIRVRSAEAEAAMSAGAEHAPSLRPAQPLTQTATELTSTQPSARVGTSVRLVATVSAATAAAPPKGTVVFRTGDEVLGSAMLGVQDGEAMASLIVLRLAVGTHLVSAEYLGQDGFDGSRSAVLTQVVTRQ